MAKEEAKKKLFFGGRDGARLQRILCADGAHECAQRYPHRGSLPVRDYFAATSQRLPAGLQPATR